MTPYVYTLIIGVLGLIIAWQRRVIRRGMKLLQDITKAAEGTTETLKQQTQMIRKQQAELEGYRKAQGGRSNGDD